MKIQKINFLFVIIFFISACSSVPKNTSFGDAFISEKHSNFFINKNNATYEDMKKLIDFVKDSVKKKKGINLDLEIEIVG